MVKNGHLVISLDFELLWGVFDKVVYSEREKYFENARKVIPEILHLFEQNKIHATWAIVGMLFNRNWDEWEKNKPNLQPHYKKSRLSPYNYGTTLKNENHTKKYVFARELIEQIKKTPYQEIGTHTYSHYYCMEEGQTIHDFRADLEKAVKLAAEMGVELKSLVFPRNQFNKEYLEVCWELGILNVRSNPSSWYWKKPQVDSLSRKIFRTGDAYIGFNDKSYRFDVLSKSKSAPMAQKASRLLRPYSGNKIQNYMKLNRIKREMIKAAKNNEIYHLWWHPHNFGNNPEQNLKDLKKILEYYSLCRAEFGFESMSMDGINELVSKEK